MSHAINVMVLREPVAMVSPTLGVPREVERVSEGQRGGIFAEGVWNLPGKLSVKLSVTNIGIPRRILDE